MLDDADRVERDPRRTECKWSAQVLERGSNQTERIIKHLTFKNEAQVKPKLVSRTDLGIPVPD